MRIALLGTGRMGRFRAEQLTRRGHDAVVASRDRRRGRPLEDVLAGKLDAAVISSSTGRHPEDIAACVERELPMLCEKPLAPTLRATRKTLDVVAAAGATLQIAFQRRFDPGFAAARAAVRDSSLGTLYLMRLSSHDHEPSPERYIPTSGGIFRDLLVHDFDMARWLTDSEVAEVYAVGALRKWERFGRYGDVDTAAVLLTMDDGLPVLVSGARHDPLGYDFRAELYGSNDSLAVGLGARTPIRSVEVDGPPPPEDPYRGFLDRFAAGFEAEMDAWLEVVCGRAENPCPGEAAQEALRVAIACDRSRAQRRPVRVAEVDDDAA